MSFQCPDWPAPSRVRAYSTLRYGGASQGNYASFNLADHVGDNILHVQQNRQRMQQIFQLPTQTYWLKQIHSNKVVVAKLMPDYPLADASITTQINCVCVVQTADCLPILMCDMQGKVVAAIHAGWRGLVSGIIENCVKQLQEYVPIKNLMAWLGPAIGPQAFEVGQDVYQAFTQHNLMAKAAFMVLENNKYLANIYLLAQQRLQHLGITQIFGGTACTFTQADRYYSYRRDNQTGRMASLIWIEK